MTERYEGPAPLYVMQWRLDGAPLIASESAEGLVAALLGDEYLYLGTIARAAARRAFLCDRATELQRGLVDKAEMEGRLSDATPREWSALLPHRSHPPPERELIWKLDVKLLVVAPDANYRSPIGEDVIYLTPGSEHLFLHSLTKLKILEYDDLTSPSRGLAPRML